MGDPARPGPQFLARSAGEGEGGWFPAPQPLIVGFGAPSLAAAVLRISVSERSVAARYSAATLPSYLNLNHATA